MIKLIRKSAWRGTSKVLVDGLGKPAKIQRAPNGCVTIEVVGAEGERYMLHVLGAADQNRLGNACHPVMRAADDAQLSGGTR